MELVQEKLKKSSKIMSVIMQIGEIGCIVGFCIALVALVWLFTFNSTEPITVLTAGGKSITINVPIGDVEDYSIRELIALCSVGTALVALYFFAFRNGRRVFKGISETGEPFREEYAALIRSVAKIMFVCALVNAVGTNVLAAILQTSTGSDSSPIGYIICALMLLCVSEVFRYGAELQRQSDETL